ncbi:MAG: nucleotidyl transferase AbiEii/AbiGii toxin family protein [Actinobacteria bacterium]|nr:nucleotidyl transferase AbiEii/AbiGii toxin family protein [Actinomycetota bacterium]
MPTDALLASLSRLTRDLHSAAVQWALIGGFAVSARAEPRFTRDVDVCVLVDDDAGAERTTYAMGGLGYRVEALIEHEYADRLATVRLESPVTGGVLVDMLFASSGIEPEVVAAAEALELVPGLVVPVARAAHLVVLKLLARDASRPQDDMDLRALRAVLTAGDADDVRRLAALVTSRGFHRERDLMGLAEDYLRQSP